MPFGLTEPEAETYAVLVPGVPPALGEALIAWLATRLADDRGWVSTEFLILMQMETALPLGVKANNIYDWSGVVEMLRRLGDVEELRSSATSRGCRSSRSATIGTPPDSDRDRENAPRTRPGAIASEVA